MSRFLQMLNEMSPLAQHLAAGQILFHAGSKVRQVHVVEKGVVHLVRYREDGGLTVMQRAGAGKVLAEASIFSVSYHCDGVAVGGVAIRSLDVDAIRSRLKSDSDFAHECASYLAQEVHRMRVRSEILSMKTVSARLAAWLSLSPLPPKGGWSALAEDLGVSREALYREIARRAASTHRSRSIVD